MNDTAIRHAKVSSIDYATGKFRVTYPDRDSSVSAEIPMISNRFYKMPKVGDTVMVALDGHGGTSGSMLGTIWNQVNMPTEGREDYFRMDMEGSYLDSDAGKVTLKSDDFIKIESDTEITATANGGDITLTASGEITLTGAAGTATLTEIIAAINHTKSH